MRIVGWILGGLGGLAALAGSALAYEVARIEAIPGPMAHALVAAAAGVVGLLATFLFGRRPKLAVGGRFAAGIAVIAALTYLGIPAGVLLILSGAAALVAGRGSRRPNPPLLRVEGVHAHILDGADKKSGYGKSGRRGHENTVR